MDGLPEYSRLHDVGVDVMYGLITQHAEPARSASFEFAWQRDRALIEAIDAAVSDAAAGKFGARASKPQWLDGLVRRELNHGSQTFWSRDSFVRVRLLQRLRLVALAPDDTYVLAMISAIGPFKADTLRADPELTQGGLWRVFEVEGGGEVSLTNVDRFGGGQWRAAFLELTADATLDRSRVLAACLAALNRDFAAYRASWFSATFLVLEPSAAEVDVLQEDLRRLLAAAVPATVAFALKQLAALAKAGTIDAHETLLALPPATSVKAKGTALAALRLAKSLAGPEQVLASHVAKAALHHPHPDVQTTAGAMLQTSGDDHAVTDAPAVMSPAVRRDLGLGSTAVEPVPAMVQPSTVQPLRAVPAPVTPSDLAERTAALLEDASDVGEFEAVLAALVVPGSQESFIPLRRRAKAVVARGPNTDIGDGWLPGQVGRLVLGLLGEPVDPGEPGVSALRFLTGRLTELRETSAPLLATPDLPGGWVSPHALVERLSIDAQPRRYDLVAALLRLHPEGRSGLGYSHLPAAVRFAMGAEVPHPRRSRSDQEAALWVAATRSRGGYTDDEMPAIDGENRSHTWRENGRERRSWHVQFTLSTSGAERPPHDLPTELGSDGAGASGQGSGRGYLGDWIPHLAALWPHDAEPFLALTCRTVLDSPGWSDAAHDVPRVLDALARHPGRMGTLAAHTLAAGISATDRDHRLHAIDAFVDLVPTGRIAVVDGATVLASHAPAWPANRWVESLTSVSGVPSATPWVIELLVELLPKLPTDHRGLNKLLTLLLEETLRLGWRVTDDDLVQWLGRFNGTSAAAKVARELLTH